MVVVEAFRYLAVSLIALMMDFLILWALVGFWGLDYLASAGLSFLAGLGFVYFSSVKWVFGYRRLSNDVLEFSFFLIIGLLGLLFSLVLMWFFVDVLSIYYLVSKLISAAFVFVFNFVLRKYILFSAKFWR